MILKHLHSHPLATAKWCGILPLNFEWVFFLGHMMLVSGYFAAHVLALTVGGLVLPGYAIPAYMVSELGLFLFWGWKYGRARWLGTSNRLGFLDVLRPEWLVMSFVPIMIFSLYLEEGRSQVGFWFPHPALPQAQVDRSARLFLYKRTKF